MVKKVKVVEVKELSDHVGRILVMLKYSNGKEKKEWITRENLEEYQNEIKQMDKDKEKDV